MRLKSMKIVQKHMENLLKKSIFSNNNSKMVIKEILDKLRNKETKTNTTITLKNNEEKEKVREMIEVGKIRVEMQDRIKSEKTQKFGYQK